jgi:hypothetical protein
LSSQIITAGWMVCEVLMRRCGLRRTKCDIGSTRTASQPTTLLKRRKEEKTGWEQEQI